jgi:hypothetical protein
LDLTTHSRGDLPMKATLIITACATVLVSTAACATTSSVFNPDGLADAQLDRVTDVCQTVLGLSPKEPLTGGEWSAAGDHLDYWTSHYRGCVTSLSDSVVRISDSQATSQADRDCRARGYASGSPDLALCVLESQDRMRSTPSASTTTSATLPLPAATGSFFYARPTDTRRREQIACAALGLEPQGGDFTGCVKSLDDTFFAIDNPIT